MTSEEELDAQIDRLHGPGAAKALDAAYADGSIFSESSRDEDPGLYLKYMVARLDVYTPPGPSVRESRRTPAILYQDEKGNIQGIRMLDEETRPGMYLCFDDPAAQDAFWVYANSVKDKQPKLAADIKEQITLAIERTKWEYGVWRQASHRGQGIVTATGSRLVAIDEQNRNGGDIVYRQPDGDWMFEVPKVKDDHIELEREKTHDWAEMPENVIDHAMRHLKPHEDGRECAYHDRLNKYTFGDNKECLRDEHFTIEGQLHERRQG